MKGPVIEPSSYFMKSPPKQFTDTEARAKVEAFIQKCGKKKPKEEKEKKEA